MSKRIAVPGEGRAQDIRVAVKQNPGLLGTTASDVSIEISHLENN